MKTIYLSGPMTGFPDLNFPAFNAEAARLRAHGYEVINPAEINADGGEWNACMRADIRAMMDCDTIALLPGWEASQGAHLEVHIAHRVGMQVVMAADICSVCQWVEEADFGWHTECGKAWSFCDGGPFENGVKFCHGCGKPIAALKVALEEEAAA